jgi:hypothetical protein
MLRRAFLGSLILSRTLGPWPFLLVLVWCLGTKLQEPSFFAGQGVPFYWASVEAVLIVAVGLLPLTWRLSQGFEACRRTLRQAASPVDQVGAIWLAHLLYGGVLLLAGAVIAVAADYITLQSIIDLRWGAAAGAATGSVACLLVSSSLAPALALQPGSTPTVICAWLMVLACQLLFFLPTGQAELAGELSEFSRAPFAPSAPSGILSVLLATLGGLAVSLAHAYHRLRH